MLCVDKPRRAATSATGRPCSATCLTAATLNSSVNRALLINVSLRRYYEAKMCLVNLGRFKEFLEHAQAAAIIKQRYPEVQFDLVGRLDANPNAIRQEELDEWVASGLINHLGYLTDVRSSIADCHVYVLPSYYREGTPRSTLEALSVGRAVITTDAPGCRETVIEGVNGFLVPTKDAAALAIAMERFINSPELIAQMGLRSRQLATEKYDVRIVNEQMLKNMGII